jgi:signal transduction histidine kinase
MHTALPPSAANDFAPSFGAPLTDAGLIGLGRDCEDLLQCLPMPAYLCDLSDGVVFQNAAAAALWGEGAKAGRQADWPEPARFKQTDGTPLPPRQTPTAIAMRERGREQGSGSRHNDAAYTLRIDRPDGSASRVVAHPRLMRDGAGNLVGALCFLCDVTECAQLEERLKQAGDKRHEFIAMLGHEIRNPLTPILNAAPLLKKTSSDSKVTYLADMIERQATHLSRFVTDLLDEAHTNSDGAATNKTMGALDDVIDGALDIVAGTIRERGQTLHQRRAPGDVALVCDIGRVAQALGNILQNASDFTGDGGTIVLTVAVRGPLLDIEVSDSGIGMRPGHIAAVFNPHHGFRHKTDNAAAGAGMGVRLAMEICRRHGGAVTASSPGLGLGSRVAIVLPVALPV